MLLPQAYRQRLSLEFKTKRNLYTDDLVEDFIEDLTHSTPIKSSEIITLTFYKVGLVAINILTKSAFIPSEVLDVVDYWFEPTELVME